MVAIRSTLRKIWDALTAPLYAVDAPKDELDTRVFTAAALLVVIVGVAAEILTRLDTARQAPTLSVNYAYLNVTLLAVAVTYVLGRTRYRRTALGLSIAILSVGVYLIALFGVQPRALALLAYVIVPILLISAFFSPRLTALLSGLLALMMVLIPVIAPDVSLQEALTGPLAFVLIVGCVQLLVGHHSQGIEAMRRQELAEMEHRYRALAEHSNAGIALLDVEGRYVEMNQRLADMLGRSAAGLIGQPMKDTIAPDGAESLQTRIGMLLSGQVVPAYEGTVSGGDERSLPVEISSTLVLGREREPARIQVIVRDISQRQADHEALRRRHRGLMVLNRIISAATTTVDDTRMLHVLCGELAYAFGLTHVYATRISHQTGTAPVVAEYAQAGAQILLGATIPLDTPVITHVLVYRTLLYINAPYTDPRMGGWLSSLPKDGKATLLFVPLIVRDRVVSILTLEFSGPLTLNAQDVELVQSSSSAVAQALETAELYRQQEKRADDLEEIVRQRTAELRQALTQAQAADRTKSQFVSNVSHELRTPLTSIRLYLDLASRGKPERIRTYLGALTRETARLQHLVESLLMVSRLDLGNVQLYERDVDLNQIVETLVADRQRLFGNHELELSVETDPALPLVRADPQLLEQVLTNLLTNAMNYTPQGGAVWLRTGSAMTDDKHWATVSVEDNGVGIPIEERGRLFQRFERGQASATLQVPGTGLGLAISKEIIDLHHGRITVESVVDEGSVFVVWLPVDDERHTQRLGTHPLASTESP